MSTPLYIRSTAVFLHGASDAADAALEARRDELPRAIARRMSAMGLAFDLVLRDDPPAEDDLLVLASEYGMSRTLEDYLDSFPNPSPLAFQNSIHPAGAEQVLVPDRRRVREFLPLAGERDLLIPAAIRAIRLAPAPVARLLLGEELATGLTRSGLASARTWAARLTLTRKPEGALGTLTPCDAGDAVSPEAFAEAVAARRPLRFGNPDQGFTALDWR